MTHQPRYYYKKSYKGNYSAFSTALFFTIVGILSLIFDKLDIDFLGLRHWGYWLFIPAFFSFSGTFSSLINDSRMRKVVLTYISIHSNNRIGVESMSKQLGIRTNDLLRILFDLRLRGKIQYKYDAQSGEILIGETVEYQKSESFEAIPTKNRAEKIVASMDTTKIEYYCPFCGHKNPEDSQFCINCGSKLAF